MYWVLGLGLLLGAVICQQDLSVRVRELEAEVRELKHLETKANEFKKLEAEFREFKQLLQYQHSYTGTTDRMRRRRAAVQPHWDHCPNGFVRNDNSCYHVSHLLASWPDALVYCEAYGADLLVIESAREQQFLSVHLLTVGVAATDPLHFFWVGGTDALVDGQWIWAKSAAPVSGFTAWNPGEPNNYPSTTHPSHHQDCMVLKNSSGIFKWDDVWCSDAHNFICEIELKSEQVGDLVG